MAKQRFFTYYIVSEAQGHTIIVPGSIQPPCEREKTNLFSGRGSRTWVSKHLTSLLTNS